MTRTPSIVSTIPVAKSSAMELQHARNGGHALKTRRHGHVQSAGHHVGEFVQGQGGPVAERSLRFPGSVVRPELPEHEVWPCTGGELHQPVDPSTLADPVAGPDVVRVYVVLESGRTRLAGREEAALGLY